VAVSYFLVYSDYFMVDDDFNWEAAVVGNSLMGNGACMTMTKLFSF